MYFYVSKNLQNIFIQYFLILSIMHLQGITFTQKKYYIALQMYFDKKADIFQALIHTNVRVL